jgi:hypothetical protein
MAKFFSRWSLDKQDCIITLTIHKLEADINTPIELSVFFERGPQKDETTHFTMGASQQCHVIEETFTRVSGFYYDRKTLSWQEKFVSLNLGHYKDSVFSSLGIVTVDMAGMVEQGDCSYVYTFPAGTIAHNFNAQLHVTINVSPDNGTVKHYTLTKPKDNIASARDSMAIKRGAATRTVASEVNDRVTTPQDFDLEKNVRYLSGVASNINTLSRVNEEETKDGHQLTKEIVQHILASGQATIRVALTEAETKLAAAQAESDRKSAEIASIMDMLVFARSKQEDLVTQLQQTRAQIQNEM